MKNQLLLLSSTMLLGLSLASFQNPKNVLESAKENNKKPNIVFVLIDDFGALDLPVYGNDFNEAPNIDKLADEGVIFDNYYTQPVCSPSRGCLMTGQNTLSTGVTDYLPGQNSLTVDFNQFQSLPKTLKTGGYKTSIIGKWHLSAGYENYPAPGSPYAADFDDVIASEQKYIANGDYFAPYFHIPQINEQVPEGKFLVDFMNEQAVDYIDKNGRGDQPFMLYLSHYATHTRLDAPQEDLDYFNAKRNTPFDMRDQSNTEQDGIVRYSQDRNPYIASMLKHIDDGIGMIDAKLEELGIKDDTILAIASDNGGSGEFTTNGILRGYKHEIYEGGIKDPLIIRYPAKMSKKGFRTDFISSVIDLYPTFVDFGAIDEMNIPKNLDGISLRSIIEGNEEPLRDTLHWVIPRLSNRDKNDPVTNVTPMNEGAAIRKGNYKYLESLGLDNRRELYDLSTDQGEQNNLFESRPDLANQLRRELHESLQDDTKNARFAANFSENEAYRWSKTTAIQQISGELRTDESYYSLMTYNSSIRYDQEINIDVTLKSAGKAGALFKSKMLTPTHRDFGAYGVTLDATNDKISLVDAKVNDATIIKSVDYKIDENKTYKLNIKTIGEKIVVSIDNQVVLEATDSRYMFGTFGIISDHATTVFDNYSNNGLDTQAPITNKQLGLEGSTKLSVNRSPLFVEEIDKFNEKIFVDVESLALAFAANVNKTAEKITINKGNVSLKISIKNKAVTLNGSPVTLELKDGTNKLLVDAISFADMLAIGVSNNNGIINFELANQYYINANNSNVNKTGKYNAIPNRTKYGYETLRLAQKDSSVEFKFYAKEAYISFMKQPSRGEFKVEIDGNEATTIKTFSNNILNNSEERIVFDKFGAHTIKLITISDEFVNINGVRVIEPKNTGLPEGMSLDLVDDNDERIIYEGNWTPIQSAPAFNETIHRTTTKDASATLKFNGTKVKLFIGAGRGAAIIDIYIDGKLEETVDCYAGDVQSRVLAFASKTLANGDHTIKIVHTGKANPNADAMNINLDAFEITTTKPVIKTSEIIDDKATDRIEYFGTWGPGGKTCTRSGTAGDRALLVFKGTKVNVVMGGGPGAGIFDIYLDGVKVKTVDGYIPKGQPTTINAYTSDVLENKEHTIEIVVTGEKNDLSTNTNVSVDKFTVWF